MPADGTVSGLHLAQSLPLMKTFTFETVFQMVLPANTSAVYQIGSFTMPFFGDMVFQGSFQIYTYSGASQQVDFLQMDSSSNPPPPFHPHSSWRCNNTGGYGHVHIPFTASWTAVPASTAVVLRAYMTNGIGVPNIQVVLANGLMFCTKT
jgi:hypothetical protein